MKCTSPTDRDDCIDLLRPTCCTDDTDFYCHPSDEKSFEKTFDENRCYPPPVACLADIMSKLTDCRELPGDTYKTVHCQDYIEETATTISTTTTEKPKPFCGVAEVCEIFDIANDIGSGSEIKALDFAILFSIMLLYS